MQDRKVVESATQVRQGRRGRPVLVVLVIGLALALIVWLGTEIWGESTDAPSEEPSTAGEAGPSGTIPSNQPAVPVPADETPHSSGGTGGQTQTNQPAGSTTRQ